MMIVIIAPFITVFIIGDVQFVVYSFTALCIVLQILDTFLNFHSVLTPHCH